MLMVGCECSVDAENVITVTASSRQIDGVGEVSCCGAGSVIITEKHTMCAIGKCNMFQQDNARVHTTRVTAQYLANSNASLCLNGQDFLLIYRQWSIFRDYLDQCISCSPQMNTLREVENALKQEWNGTHPPSPLPPTIRANISGRKEYVTWLALLHMVVIRASDFLL